VFLKQSAERYLWAHPVIPEMVSEAWPNRRKRPSHLQKGGTGFGARPRVRFLREWAAPS